MKTNQLFSSRTRHRFLLLMLLTLFTCGNAWGDVLYTEDWETNHRTSGSNNYGAGPKTYGDWDFAYADAVSSGSPLAGSYHAILRVAKSTTNSPSLISGALLSSSATITKVGWKCKGFSGCTLKVSYSTNGSTWTEKFSSTISTTTQDKSFNISPGVSGPIYLKFVVTVSSTNKNNRDANIDNITIEGTAGTPTCATPTFNNGTATYNNDVPVTISCATASSTIHYTTNGTDPTCSSGSTGTSVTINSTGTVLKAIACKADYDASEVASATYTLKCATPTGLTTDTYVGTQTVTLATTTVGASIYYTTDGSNPTASSTHYTAPFSVSSTSTIKAIAIKSNYVNSDIASATYTITPAYVVTWKNQGSTVTTTNVASGSKPVFPDMSLQSGCGKYTYFYGWAEDTWTGEVSSPGTSSTIKVYKVASEMPNVSGNVTYHAVWSDTQGGYALVESDLGSSWAGDYLIAYSSTIFADGRVGGTSTGGIGKQYVKVNPGDNLSGKVVNATWGDTYYVTLEELSENSNTYLLKTQDGNYNYYSSNSNGLSSTSSRSTADDYPITVTFTSSSDVKLCLGGSAAGAVFRYNTAEFFRYYKDGGQNAVYLYKKGATGGKCVTSCCNELGTINGSITLNQSGTSVTVKGWTYTQGGAAAESNIATYDVYLYSDADSYADPIQTQTCAYNAKATGVTFTSLSYGTTYKIKIGATGNTNYCDITPIQVTTINSTSTQTFQLACDVPTNVTATSVTASSATVSWDDVATNYQYVLDQSSSDPAGAGTAVNGAHSVNLSVSASTNYYFHVRTNCGNSVFSSWATISFSTPAAACTGYSFHDGTDGSNPSDWQINCFTYSGNSDRQWLKDFTIRNKSHYYVGYQGNFYNDNLGNSNAKSYTNQMQYMQLALDRTHGSNNQLGSNYAGVQGTLLCYDNSSADNLYVDFLPDGYYFILDAAGTPTALEMTCTNPDMTAANILSNNSVWETSIQTITYVNKKYTVGIKANSAIAGKTWQTTRYNTNEDMTTLKKRNSSGGFTGTLAAADVTAGTRGKYRIWADNFSTTAGEKNWYAHFVPYYRVTYNGNGASGSVAASADVCSEGNAAARTVVAAANGFTVPTGKQFGGWATSAANASAGTVAYAAGENIVLTADVELFPVWTDIDYTVAVNQSPNVSATTTGQTSSAHYNTTINLTTTVPSGYRFVNWTTSDGFSISNSTSATTASFTMPNKNVTVTANFQQTHTVDWYVGGSAPANKIGDDGQTTVVDHGGKIEDFPATTPDGSACDKEFVGWTNTTSYTHGTSLLFNDVAGSPTINADANFYAVFAEVNSVSASLTKMTADDDLEVGDKIVIIAQDTRYGMYQASASSYVSYWTTTDVDGEPSLSEIEADDKKYLDVAAGSASNTWKLGDATNGYLYNASSTNLEFSTTNSSDLTLITWTDDSFTFVAGQEVSCRTDITGANANKWRGAGASCDPETGDNCSGTPYYYLYKYVPSSTTATGHTIICASCSNEVTVSFSAPGSGNTMTVAKGVTSISSGDAVKTCSAVSLTVTLTPAPHYSVTDFAATGVTGVTTTNVGNVYTVNIPADKTGTLTLTPTFTAETPLTITLSTNGKGTYSDPAEWPIYAGESFTLPSVTPNDPSCATFVGWIQGTTFDGDGSTHDAPVTISAGSSSGALSVNTTYTAVFYETETTETDAYVKVTETPANWANDHYLIVDEEEGVTFDGSRTDDEGDKIDAASNTVAVTITSSAIAATNALAASEWKIALVSGSDYSIQSASGKYIGNASNSNALTTSASALNNTLAISSGDFEVVSAGGAYLRYNATDGQERFRYYKSSSYSLQHAIQLYKLGTAVIETRTYTTDPACTVKYRVTVASVTGGSPTAAPKFLPEGEEVTLTANPAAGYSFTGWTLTHTEGGAAASVTYTTGSASTATAVFEMPAYDVTVTAGYAKKMVTELQVKDGETVIANSGTLNISTGANKTLTVVVTPADAYDHSWTATVTAGGTYASITNTTAEGFRVNGLAQGDATITVNAPNDGDAKTVTFTVHVTDILPEAIILKRDGSSAEIETLTMYYDTENSRGQYAKINVSYTPTPTNKRFSTTNNMPTKTATIDAPVAGYTTIHANGLTGETPATITFTSEADGSVTKVLTVTILPLLADQFVDYIHGNATQTVSARLSADRYSMITDINTPPLTDASDAYPTSEDCETAHYHLIGWLPQATAEALWEAGTPITAATEGLVRAGVTVEATGQTWYAIWAKEE